MVGFPIESIPPSTLSTLPKAKGDKAIVVLSTRKPKISIFFNSIIARPKQY